MSATDRYVLQFNRKRLDGDDIKGRKQKIDSLSAQDAFCEMHDIKAHCRTTQKGDMSGKEQIIAVHSKWYTA